MLLPERYSWLLKEGAPKILVEALKLYGVSEIEGIKSNKIILDWAKEVKIPSSVYSNDDIAWCGLFMAVVVKRTGRDVIENPLWARNWAKWGVKSDRAMLGDILVFTRKTGGHVGVYVGEDEFCYHVLGGNQNNSVNITRIKKTRILDIRRPKYNLMPSNVRVINLKATGTISKNES